jgi:valyl-tRNA synthetase
MDTRFDHSKSEEKIYDKWEKSGFFNPDVCIEKGITKKSAKQFSIVLPPPNVTGTLHMGHAVMLAIQDIMIRFARMKGFKTLWVPGTDSAALATQSKVEEILYKKENKTRHDIGREELLHRIEIFTDESKSTIINQIRKMGSSLDWTRYAYTMDEIRYRAVMEAFVRMYKAGLIYRGNRIVNWDPKMQTTVSDDEIEYVEKKDPFYYIQYGPFVIGTVRPETKFGDKYVVIHPEDLRYKQYKHGDKLELEWINGPISATVIKDKASDISFGSGVMTITPAHSLVDFEIAQHHGLDIDQIIDDRGILLPITGEFSGQHIKKARGAIVEKLRQKGLLVKVDENYIHNISTNSRGGGIIEPQIKKQWFIDVNKEFVILNSKIPGIKSKSKTTLKKIMKSAVQYGGIEILPKRFNKIYYHWIENLRDWCISRQIWFGHRIPVWYHEPKCVPRPGHEKDVAKCIETIVAVEKPVCKFCYANYVQDPDTLDTWFSSGLWTFSTLGWPEKTKDFMTYHPTTILETGYDIIFFWVARMILMSGFLLGDVPFKKVYLHGLVRDAQGRKMSKSLGNIMDPLDMINKYGADATRLSLIIGAGPGNDSKLSEDKVRGYRNFTTKIWNASRFVIMSYNPSTTKAKLTSKDKAHIKEVLTTKKKIEGYINKYDFNRAGETAYHYFWHKFADKIIEEYKPRLQGDNVASRVAAQETLLKILSESLKFLHPFVPFVTEEVWGLLPLKEREGMLIVEKW